MSEPVSRPGKCRSCTGDLFNHPLLTYPQSPNSAQGFQDFPTAESCVELNIYQCTCCGLVQHDLLPVPYFKDVIRAIAFSEEMRIYRVEQLRSWLEEVKCQGKRILEIGCGKGEYLDLLTQAGAKNVFGLENSLQNIGSAKEKGLNVKKGYLDEGFANPWGHSFDAFVIFSFMEHWPNLHISLRKLHALLEDGAAGLIEVPNFEFIFENGLYSEFTPDHIFYFDQKTLALILELNGFEVESIDVIWHDYIISARVKKRVQINASHFVMQQDILIEQINNFVDNFSPADVVVWGAGHQALSVLSLARLNNKISHVVDSADFKQGKYTPGTNILIKSPESLLLDKPKAVLIMAAAYSDEVAIQLALKYPQIKNIAILRERHLEICDVRQ